MSEVLQANVFFFITGIAVIVFTLLLCIALYHIIKILKSVRTIINRIEAGSEVIAEDLSDLRDYFREGSVFSHLIGVFLGYRGGAKKKPTRSKKRTVRKGSSRASLKIVDEE